MPGFPGVSPLSLLKLALTLAAPVFADTAGPPGGTATGDVEIRAAGCYIATKDGVIVNHNRLLNKLQLPMGRHRLGESAVQTAIRETKEETGLDVRVIGPLLSIDQQGIIVLFLCAPTQTVDYQRLEARDKVEVAEVLVLNPHTLRNHDGRLIELAWRFPTTHLMLKTLFPPPP